MVIISRCFTHATITAVKVRSNFALVCFVIVVAARQLNGVENIEKNEKLFCRRKPAGT